MATTKTATVKKAAARKAAAAKKVAVNKTATVTKAAAKKSAVAKTTVAKTPVSEDAGSEEDRGCEEGRSEEGGDCEEAGCKKGRGEARSGDEAAWPAVSRLRGVASVVACGALWACIPRPPPGSATSSSNPAHSDDGGAAALLAAEPKPPGAVSMSPVIPPDPREQVDFEPAALAFGPCHLQNAEYEAPFVVGHGVETWREGEPLWAMTNTGGVVPAAAGKRFEYCGWGISKPAELRGSEDEEETCVTAWTLVTAAPLRCDEPLRAGLPEGLAEEAGLEQSLVFATHRRHRPPTLVPLSFEVRVHAVCQDPAKDFDEPGAKVPVVSAAAPIDRRFAQQIPKLDKQRWRAIRVSSADPAQPTLYVLHTAEARNRVKQSQWFVFREHTNGDLTSLVARADRIWHDSPMVRERNCGLPSFVPFPLLAFLRAGKLYWLTGVETETIVAQVWEVGSERLRGVHTLPVALYAPKG